MTLPPVPAQKESYAVVRVKLADLAKMSPEDREHIIAAIVAVAKLPRSSSSEEPE